MKLEKFDYNNRKGKKYFLYGVICTILLTIVFNLIMSKASYRTTQSINIVKGNINYKVPDLRVVALYTKNESNEYVETSNIPTSGYTLNQEKSVCKVYDGSTSIEDAPIETNIIINYHDGVIGIDNLTKKNTRCYLYFDEKGPTVSETIFSNIKINTTKPNFNSNATTNEGVFAVSDGMYGGTSYYWRGAVTNNYVSFAGFCWRIIRINGDGSIRLIYDGTSCHANGTDTTDNLISMTAYNTSSGYSYYAGWSYDATQHGTGTNSNAKTILEAWYANNLEEYTNYIADGKFCNDRSVGSGTWTASGDTFDYAAYTRLFDNKIPTLNCNNSKDIFTLKVGLITADEVAFAGTGAYEGHTGNEYYYLYNGNYYWTMTPNYWSNYRNSTSTSVFAVCGDGDIEYSSKIDNKYGLRPVINIRSDVTFSSGNGTISTPYVIST